MVALKYCLEWIGKVRLSIIEDYGRRVVTSRAPKKYKSLIFRCI